MDNGDGSVKFGCGSDWRWWLALGTKREVCGSGVRLKVEMVSPGPGFMASKGGGGSSDAGTDMVCGGGVDIHMQLALRGRGAGKARWRGPSGVLA